MLPVTVTTDVSKSITIPPDSQKEIRIKSKFVNICDEILLGNEYYDYLYQVDERIKSIEVSGRKHLHVKGTLRQNGREKEVRLKYREKYPDEDEGYYSCDEDDYDEEESENEEIEESSGIMERVTEYFQTIASPRDDQANEVEEEACEDVEVEEVHTYMGKPINLQKYLNTHQLEFIEPLESRSQNLCQIQTHAFHTSCAICHYPDTTRQHARN